MKTGSLILAPQGYRELRSNEQYYFLVSDGQVNRVRLIRFTESNGEVRSEIISIPRLDFELALENGDVREEFDSEKFPYWLKGINGISIDYLEQYRISHVKSYEDRMNHRYLAIADLVIRHDAILAAEQPEVEINKYARQQKLNSTRVRAWFFTYVIFGFNKLALMPRFHNCGGRGRDRDLGGMKVGRPSKKGKKTGFGITPDMKELMLRGYVACKSDEHSWNTIYGEVVTRFFGCVTRLGSKGKTEFHHPNGSPFPSLWQFKYWVGKSFSSKLLLEDRIGAISARAQSGSQGSFSEILTNVYQQVEFDGFHFSEKISGILEETSMDGFCVVRAVCALTGIVLGIGFAEGAENMEAYRMCLFSMAVPKKKYCELFGVSISEHEWPCYGLPPNILFDRGPGRGYDPAQQVSWLGVFEMAPSYSGQSKSNVESSHPRKKKILRRPSHHHSNLNFIEMVKRQIYTVIQDNKTSRAHRRAHDEMYECGFVPNPNNIFLYYDTRGRNSAKDIPFSESVRRFLTPHAVKIKRDAVYFYGRKYRSEDLVQTGIFDEVAKRVEVESTAYALTMCVRHIWLEHRGQIFELDVVLSSSADPDGLDITLRDLMDIDTRRKLAMAELCEEIPAAQQDVRNRFKEDTGKDWNSGVRKAGPPKKNALAKETAKDHQRFFGGGDK
ncbi:transposase [Pseudomonas monteilii]|uniref:transposase n=1 Tax=Pseudomonas monteilii TaxID=76759 RepID=UPI00381F0AC5